MEKDTAHNGIRKILDLLTEDDAIQLALTTTQRNLKQETIQNKTDAIEIIIRYSTDYTTILSRKVVKRELLFQYLHQNCVPITAPAAKVTLIQKILEYWEKSSIEQQDNITKEESTVATVEPAENIDLLATKFTEWFYAMWNQDEVISEEHFWQDCSLQMQLTSPHSQTERIVDNNRAEVVEVLTNTKQQHNLFFNPNLTSDGVFGKMDAHGLVMVFVCGTLHTRETCVGIFEQIFALARDPFAENNWKIKNTKINLKSRNNVNDTPRLCDTELNSELVTYIQS